MLLLVGRNSEQFLEADDGFLHLFLPGRYDGMTEMRVGTAFELFARSDRRIFMNGTPEAPFMRMPRIAEPRGITFVNDGDVPLVLRAAHGLGTVIYFGGDLSERPLANWRERTTLVRNVMQWDSQRRAGIDHRAGAIMQLGYNDISGQIRSALDRFEGVYVVPFSIILVILVAYWLVIGLFDWYFVHKVLKRPMMTWLTLPMWIILFSVLTYALAAPGRPVETIYNILRVVDVDYETGINRVSVWESQYSPIDKQIQRSGYIADLSHFSWFGLPGSGLGGMSPNTVSPPVWQIGSEQVSYSRIENIPTQTRSSKSFFGQNYSNGLSKITARLSDEEGIPIGTVTVPEDFLFHLQNTILVYGRWSIELGDVSPGDRIELTRRTPRREMRDLLFPPRVLEDEHLRRVATYNPQSIDLDYIVRVMSLHRALGGFESIGLHNAYQSSLDLSNLLTADRILLLGTVSQPDDHYLATIFRQSFPITLTELSPRLRTERREAERDILDTPVHQEFFTDTERTNTDR